MIMKQSVKVSATVPSAGGCRSWMVPAHPDPGESHSFSPGRERSVGPSKDRIWQDSRLCCACHTAHPGIQTGQGTNCTVSCAHGIQLVSAHCLFSFLDLFPCGWGLQSVREQDVKALILVPTKELGQQVQTMVRQLTAYCSRDVRVADISGKADLSAQR